MLLRHTEMSRSIAILSL